jgi:hypothetical protein
MARGLWTGRGAGRGGPGPTYAEPCATPAQAPELSARSAKGGLPSPVTQSEGPLDIPENLEWHGCRTRKKWAFQFSMAFDPARKWAFFRVRNKLFTFGTDGSLAWPFDAQ